MSRFNANGLRARSPRRAAAIAFAVSGFATMPPFGCAAMDERPTASPVPAAPVTVYACQDGRTLRASYPDAVTALVDYQGRRHILKQAVSADGVRYVGDGLQWWTRGLTRGAISPLRADETYAPPGVECTAPEAPAK